MSKEGFYLFLAGVAVGVLVSFYWAIDQNLGVIHRMNEMERQWSLDRAELDVRRRRDGVEFDKDRKAWREIEAKLELK